MSIESIDPNQSRTTTAPEVTYSVLDEDNGVVVVRAGQLVVCLTAERKLVALGIMVQGEVRLVTNAWLARSPTARDSELRRRRAVRERNRASRLEAVEPDPILPPEVCYDSDFPVDVGVSAA